MADMDSLYCEEILPGQDKYNKENLKVDEAINQNFIGNEAIEEVVEEETTSDDDIETDNVILIPPRLPGGSDTPFDDGVNSDEFIPDSESAVLPGNSRNYIPHQGLDIVPIISGIINSNNDLVENSPPLVENVVPILVQPSFVYSGIASEEINIVDHIRLNQHYCKNPIFNAEPHLESGKSNSSFQNVSIKSFQDDKPIVPKFFQVDSMLDYGKCDQALNLSKDSSLSCKVFSKVSNYF